MKEWLVRETGKHIEVFRITREITSTSGLSIVRAQERQQDTSSSESGQWMPPYALDLTTQEIIFKGERRRLGVRQFRIAQALLNARGEVVPTGPLIAVVFSGSSTVDDTQANLKVQISHLRKLFRNMGLGVRIDNYAKCGYVLRREADFIHSEPVGSSAQMIRELALPNCTLERITQE